MDLGLANKAVLIGGGSRGIGRATALAFAREQARVFVVARGQEDLERTVGELTALGVEAAGAAVDLSGIVGCQAAVRGCLDALGALDVLVNNAGGSLGSGSFDATTAQQWSQVMDLNLMSAVWTSQAALDWMKEHGGGAIVHVSSICGREYCTSAAYTAAKAAMIGLAKEMAIDLAKYQVRVNSVAPGSILFPGGSWDRRLKKDPARIQKMIDTELPWGRFGTPEEVAEVVVFLASSKASWMSGACVAVDGAQGRAF